MWSLLGDEAGGGSRGPGLAVVSLHVRWARWLLGEIEVLSGITLEGWVGDLDSLHVLVWVVFPGWVNDER